ncbi:hypothetical protein Tco_0771678 [Tanacetum coccineum]|uniref:Uncharacterized protein n=1 Tax=Tanacetum coccineum TaxID=301880 RepID=A0ABQ4ZGT7_9ASTR
MSSSLSHATVTYTSISSVMPSWAIPLMDAYEFDPKEPEAASQSPEHAPLSPVPALDYIADFEPIEDDSEEDPEIDLVDYPSDEEEEEPSTLTDPASPVQDSVPSSEETEPFETDESAATPPSPILLFHYLRLVSYGYAHTPPSLPPSSLSPLSSPLPLIPSLPLLLPSLDRRAAAATREPGSTLARGIDYGLMTALEEVKESVADMATRHKQDNQEAMYTRQAWSQAMNCNHALHAEVGVFRAETRVLQQQRRYDHDLWTRAIGRIQELERARDP